MRLSLSSLTAAAGATAAVLAAAAPAQGANTVFGGTAKSGAPIVVQADAKLQALTSIVLSWYAACGDSHTFPGGGALTPAKPVAGFAPGPNELLISKNAKGKFAGTQLASRDLGSSVAAISVTVAGKLKPDRASGTFAAIVKIADKTTGAEVTSCQTGTVNWVAARNPGIVYGGVTSQSEPLVIRLDAARKRVNDVVTTWNASCGDAGYFSVPDHFVNFPVKSTGRFGNPFTDDFTLPDQTKRHYDYNVSGRLGKTGAKGTLSVKVTETDPAGVATVCDSGGVTWKAVTG